MWSSTSLPIAQRRHPSQIALSRERFWRSLILMLQRCSLCTARTSPRRILSMSSLALSPHLMLKYDAPRFSAASHQTRRLSSVVPSFSSDRTVSFSLQIPCILSLPNPTDKPTYTTYLCRPIAYTSLDLYSLLCSHTLPPYVFYRLDMIPSFHLLSLTIYRLLDADIATHLFLLSMVYPKNSNASDMCICRLKNTQSRYIHSGAN